MARFIKLHQVAGVDLQTGTAALDPIWINADQITGVGLETNGKRTFIYVSGGRFIVEESPEEAMEAIGEKPIVAVKEETESSIEEDLMLTAFRKLNDHGKQEAYDFVRYLTGLKWWRDQAAKEQKNG